MTKILLICLVALASIPLSLHANSWSFLKSQLGQKTGSSLKYQNDLHLFRDGGEFYPEYLRIIQSAKKSIDIQMYLWCDDEAGLNLAKNLAMKAHTGVRVRVLIEFMNTVPHERVYKMLSSAGVHLMQFNRLGDRGLNTRLHEKILIVDGEYVLTGGANFCNEYLIDPKNYTTTEHGSNLPLWHDFVLKIRGDLSYEFQKKYDQNWNETSEFQHAKDHMYDGMLTEEFFRGTGPSINRFPHKNPLFPPTYSPFANGGGDAAFQSAGLLWQRPYQNKKERKIYSDFYLELVAQTQKSLVLYSPYLVLFNGMKETLKSLAKRGVSVVVLTNARQFNDSASPMVHRALLNYPELLESGVRIFETRFRTQHAKAMLIDHQTLLVGSHNFNRRSQVLNGEIMVATNSDSVVAKFQDIIKEDLKNDYQEVTIQNFSPPTGKLAKWVAKLWGHFL